MGQKREKKVNLSQSSLFPPMIKSHDASARSNTHIVKAFQASTGMRPRRLTSHSIAGPFLEFTALHKSFFSREKKDTTNNCTHYIFIAGIHPGLFISTERLRQ